MSKVRCVAAAFVVGFWTVAAAVAMAGPDEEVTPVAIAELLSNPASYNGKLIRTSGIMGTSNVFESVASLSDGVIRPDGSVNLKEPSIYLDVWRGAGLENERDCVVQEIEAGGSTDGGPAKARYCTVDVKGVFEYGGRYGGLHKYPFQIRRWQPPEDEIVESPHEPVEAVPNPVQAQVFPVRPSDRPWPPQVESTKPMQAPPIGSSRPVTRAPSGGSSHPVTRAPEVGPSAQPIATPVESETPQRSR